MPSRADNISPSDALRLLRVLALATLRSAIPYVTAIQSSFAYSITFRNAIHHARFPSLTLDPYSCSSWDIFVAVVV